MAKDKSVKSPGKKAMLNEAKSDQAKGKKQVLKVKGRVESKVKPDIPQKPEPKDNKFNSGLPPAKKDTKKKKKSGKSNVPNAY
jgi:hypothetical protein